MLATPKTTTGLSGKSLIVMAVLLALLGCSDTFYGTVQVKNESGAAVQDVSVTVAGKAVWSGDLRPAQSIKANFVSNKDSDVTVQATIAGKSHKKSFGYVTPGKQGRHLVIFKANSEITYRAKR